MAARRPDKTAAAQRTEDLEPFPAKATLRNNLSNHALWVIQDRVFIRATFIHQAALAPMNVFFRHWHQIRTALQAPIPAPLRPVSLMPDAFVGNLPPPPPPPLPLGRELTFFKRFVAAVAQGTQGAPAWLEEAYHLYL